MVESGAERLRLLRLDKARCSLVTWVPPLSSSARGMTDHLNDVEMLEASLSLSRYPLKDTFKWRHKEASVRPRATTHNPQHQKMMVENE